MAATDTQATPTRREEGPAPVRAPRSNRRVRYVLTPRTPAGRRLPVADAQQIAELLLTYTDPEGGEAR